LPAAVDPDAPEGGSGIRLVLRDVVADAPSHSNLRRQLQRLLLKVSWRPVDDAHTRKRR
jgi:hypothetical protein